MTDDVVISGAGPNGLMLACELSLAGIRPIVLERLPARSGEPKANGLVGQVVKLVDHRGLYERLSRTPGPPRPNSGFFMFAGLPLNLGLLEDSPLYVLPVPQRHIEQVLEERALELGVRIRRGHEVVGLSQDDDAVTVEVDGPDGRYEVQARYLVGVDGAHSLTRKLSGIDFPGVSYDRTTTRMAHVTVPPEWVDPVTSGLKIPGFGTALPFMGNRTEQGGFSYAPLPDHPPTIATVEWDQPATDEPMSLDELRASIRRVLGVDVPIGAPTGDGPHLLRRMSGSNTRLAERFRDRRVFLVGDAAHIHAQGGSGLNLGMQDAANLAWKLAAELHGRAPSGLLDTYDTERRQAASRTEVGAQAQAALLAPGSDVTALRDVFGELLCDRDTVQRVADLISGTDLRYDTTEPDAHPLVGRFVPSMDLHTSDGTVRLAELTRNARPLLLDLTEDGSLAGAEWHDQVDVVTGSSTEAGVTALLLRPDCFVAWASSSPEPDLDSLRTAMKQWVCAAGEVRSAPSVSPAP